MSHYSKIERMTSNDSKFDQLSDDAKLTFFILLTHPHLTSLGAMRSSFAGLASEMNWGYEKFKEAITELMTRGIVQADEERRFVWFPNFLKHNQPESPNVVKSWERALNYLPECALKNRLIVQVKAFVEDLPRSFQEALPAIFSCPSASLSEESLAESVDPSERLSEENSAELLEPSERLSEGCLSEFLAPTTDLRESITRTITTTRARTITITEGESREETRKQQDEENGVLTHIVALARPGGCVNPDIIFVFNAWKTTLGHPQAVLDKKRKAWIRQALQSGYTADQLCEAIRGCSVTPYNMGKNDRGQRYDGLHVILKDADQIERFMRNAQCPPRERNAAEALLDSNQAVCDEWLRDKLFEVEVQNEIV
jgi:hypothetical protein